MKKISSQNWRNIIGVVLIFIGLALIVYDFFSPPRGQLSNFTLIIFAKIIAIAGSLMNIKFKLPDK